jgi:hypothetical protein
MGVPEAATAQLRQQALSDFDDIHEISIREMAAAALQAQGVFRRRGPIGLATHHIALDVRYNVEGDGNPARMFELQSARIAPNEEAMHLPLFKANLVRMEPRTHELLRTEPDYITGFLILCSYIFACGHTCIFAYKPHRQS